MRMKLHCRQQGYIALTSAIIISMLLVAIAIGFGFSSLFGRLAILDSQSKEQSQSLAEACVNVAMLNLAQGSLATGPITVGSDHCDIISIQSNTPAPGQSTIKTQAVINYAYTDLQAVVDQNSFAIISWKELAHF